MKSLYKTLKSLVFVLLGTMSLHAQEPAVQDTLTPAVKTDSRRMEMTIGRIKTDMEGMRAVISPMGEGDPIRWAQGLPGVTTGADGTTSMYVRGGNAGNNMFTLDGVPVYGYSHILGLTTIVPNDVMENVSLSKGGFDGSENNFTAGHMKIVTKDHVDKYRTSFAINNFLVSAGTEGYAGNKLSYILSARVSPLTYEYRAVRKILPEIVGGMDNFNAKVGDLYGKLHFQANEKNALDASFLGSMDSYGFDTQGDSHDEMSWNNLIGILRYRYRGSITDIDITTSVNRYGSSQMQEKTYRGEESALSLKSSLMEYGLKTGFMHRFLDGRFILGEGLNLRRARFAPGQVGEDTRISNTMLSTLWFQAEYNIPEKLSAKAVFRANIFRNYNLLVEEARPTPYRKRGSHKDPEYSLSLKWNFMRNVAFEATFDKMMQYYHTLEGLPVGWSLDMVVPTGEKVLPESSLQGSAGFSGHFGAHEISLGGFYKRMENLIYYKYSQALFNGVLAEWERHVELGNGRSYGMETLYEFQNKDWYARLSYTLSKTTREDFPSFYGGKPFHARFDRRHVLNATAQWKGINASFILQSGHWENGAAETYEMPYLGTDPQWTASYFSGINNFQMPTVIRLDLGYQFKFTTGIIGHSVNVGVCNVTNHFNPFMLYFDAVTESWKGMAILPILPNFSWRIEF